MEFYNEQLSGVTYLCYKVLQEDELDQLSLGMLTNNRISHLLPAASYNMDGVDIIRYNISSKVTLRTFFSGMINKKQVITAFRSIAEGLLEAEEYMLEDSQVVLDADHIYVNVGNGTCYLLYLPLENRNEEVDLRRLLKEMLFNARFDTRENGDYILELTNYLNGTQNFSVTDFKHMLQKLQERDYDRSERVQAEPVGNPMQKSWASEYPNTSVERSASKDVSATAVPDMSGQPDGGTEKKKRLFGKKEKSASVTPEPAKTSDRDIDIPGGKTGSGKPPKAEKPTGPEKPAKTEKTAKPEKPAKPEKSAKSEKPAKEKKSWFLFGSKSKASALPEETEESGAVQMIKPVLPVQSMPPAPAGETTVLSAGMPNETTVLGANPTLTEAGAYLIRKKTGETIWIRKNPFRIGKERSYVDYCITDNSAVSRSHADILCENGTYRIVDNNSLNHTYIDGQQLAAQMPEELKEGAVIRLGDEEFTFKRKIGD